MSNTNNKITFMKIIDKSLELAAKPLKYLGQFFKWCVSLGKGGQPRADRVLRGSSQPAAARARPPEVTRPKSAVYLLEHEMDECDVVQNKLHKLAKYAHEKSQKVKDTKKGDQSANLLQCSADLEMLAALVLKLGTINDEIRKNTVRDLINHINYINTQAEYLKSGTAGRITKNDAIKQDLKRYLASAKDALASSDRMNLSKAIHELQSFAIIMEANIKPKILGIF